MDGKTPAAGAGSLGLGLGLGLGGGAQEQQQQQLESSMRFDSVAVTRQTRWVRQALGELLGGTDFTPVGADWPTLEDEDEGEGYGLVAANDDDGTALLDLEEEEEEGIFDAEVGFAGAFRREKAEERAANVGAGAAAVEGKGSAAAAAAAAAALAQHKDEFCIEFDAFQSRCRDNSPEVARRLAEALRRVRELSAMMEGKETTIEEALDPQRMWSKAQALCGEAGMGTLLADALLRAGRQRFVAVASEGLTHPQHVAFEEAVLCCLWKMSRLDKNVESMRNVLQPLIDAMELPSRSGRRTVCETASAAEDELVVKMRHRIRSHAMKVVHNMAFQQSVAKLLAEVVSPALVELLSVHDCCAKFAHRSLSPCRPCATDDALLAATAIQSIAGHGAHDARVLCHVAVPSFFEMLRIRPNDREQVEKHARRSRSKSAAGASASRAAAASATPAGPPGSASGDAEMVDVSGTNSADVVQVFQGKEAVHSGRREDGADIAQVGNVDEDGDGDNDHGDDDDEDDVAKFISDSWEKGCAALRNIAVAPASQVYLMKQGAIDVLLPLLHVAGNHREEAVNALRNIASDSENQELMTRDDILAALQGLLADPDTTAGEKAGCAAAFRNLSVRASSRVQIAERGVVAHIIPLIVNGTAEQRLQGCAFLRNMSVPRNSPEQNREGGRDSLLIEPLVPAIEALAGTVREIKDMEDVDENDETLTDSKNHAAFALWNAARFPRAELAVIRSGQFPAAISVVREDSIAVERRRAQSQKLLFAVVCDDDSVEKSLAEESVFLARPYDKPYKGTLLHVAAQNMSRGSIIAMARDPRFDWMLREADDDNKLPWQRIPEVSDNDEDDEKRTFCNALLSFLKCTPATRGRCLLWCALEMRRDQMIGATNLGSLPFDVVLQHIAPYFAGTDPWIPSSLLPPAPLRPANVIEDDLFEEEGGDGGTGSLTGQPPH